MKAAKGPQELKFISFLIAVVRTSLLKYNEFPCAEAVQKLVDMNLFQAGQIQLEPFRVKWLYSSSTYECLHEHERLINALHRRFSNKHLTKEEQKGKKEEYRRKQRGKKKRKGKVTQQGSTTRLNLLEFIDLLKATRTIHVSSTGDGDHRQCTRSELTLIFRASSGPDPLPRGLSLPQFLDALARCAMLMAFRDQKAEQQDASECYPHLGVHEHGSAVALEKEGEKYNSSLSDEDKHFEAEPEKRGLDFFATLSLARAIEKYIIPHFEAFTQHG
jgi:hypothetical protein